MPRKRTLKQDNQYPTRVYRGKSSWEWHPKEGGSVSLCPLDSSPGKVWQAYEAAVEARGKRPRHTVGDLAAAYFASRNFLGLRPRTQQDYMDCWGMLKKMFDEVDAHKVKQKHIRAYMDHRAKTSEVRANRERVTLQNIYSHAFEYSVVELNPCRGVRNFKETPRDYYIDDEEYNWYYDESEEAVQLFMELSYLNASRGQDVRLIRMIDLNDIGIYIQQQKTGKKQIKEWTDRLHLAVERAKARRAKILGKLKVDSLYLLVTRTGTPYTADGLKTLWAKNKQKIQAKFDSKITFTYHDIKAKGVSDYSGDKQKFSGHKSFKQMQDYDRRTQVVPSLQVPVRGQYIRK